MGVGCLANAARCGRIHCYVTEPLFLLAAVFVALSGLGVVSLHPGLFLLFVLGACCLTQCAEIPFGKYRRGSWSLPLQDQPRRRGFNRAVLHRNL